MALQSNLLKGDRALEACLVSDPAHVKQGAVGDHVFKIQQALSILDGTKIDPGEVAAKRYGSSTAAAVLIYKKKRSIINRSYQTQPDNIVGKMTIAALDKEMFLFEHSQPVPPPTPSTALSQVTVWINAFIHKTVKDGKGGLLTFPLAAGPRRGKIVIGGPVPLFPDCYLTDNRDFDNNITAESRIHAEISIDFTGATPRISTSRPKVLKCFPSMRFRISDGEVLNSATGIVKGDLMPDPTTMAPGSKQVAIRVNLASNNPVARGPMLIPNPLGFPPMIPNPIPTRFDPPPPPGMDPDIDIEGTITIDAVSRSVEFTGRLDRFPFFEMYASKDGGATSQALFRIEPTPGDTPANLFGKANRDVTTLLGKVAKVIL